MVIAIISTVFFENSPTATLAPQQQLKPNLQTSIAAPGTVSAQDIWVGKSALELKNITEANKGLTDTQKLLLGRLDKLEKGGVPGQPQSQQSQAVVEPKPLMNFDKPRVATAPPPPPTVDACTADPTLSGCSSVLPSLDTCTSNPTTPGCTAVLPSIDTCTTTPTAPGCTAVLPPLADCTLNPTLVGCTAVLPPLADCTPNPALAGCTAVLPPLATCATDPTLPGCTAVLPLLEGKAARAGLQVVRGGRFHHLIGAGQDKGRAVRLLREISSVRDGRQIRTIGLGDSENDLPMLAAVDIPVLIPRLDGSSPDIQLPGLVRAVEPGSRGWNEAVERLLDELRIPALNG